MELKDYKKKDFRPFCIEEIKEAFRQGIDPLLIELYMNDTNLSNLQLRQIRLGLQEELDVSAYARASMSYGDMSIYSTSCLGYCLGMIAENETKSSNSIKVAY